MIDLVFASPDLATLSVLMWREKELETAAFILASPVYIAERDYWRLLVREVHVVPDDQYKHRTSVRACATVEFQLQMESRAKRKGWTVVYCHTHPQEQGLPFFSPQDDRTELALARHLGIRIPDIPHASMVLGQRKLRARRLGAEEPVRVIEVGRNLDFAFDPAPTGPLEATYDRQVLAFSDEGQHVLHGLRVGVVGVGGTGSVVVQQLAHLGVKDYLLVDCDDVEESNLNRLAGATSDDVGDPKVKVAERVIRNLRHDAIVEPLQADILDAGTGRRLAGADFVFCCTDSHASRNLINQLAYQYFVPCIDMGVGLGVGRDTGSVSITGRVTMLAPGLACLHCYENINPRAVQVELMSPEQRAADEYIDSAEGVKQPSVMSLTSTVASLAVTMFLGATVGIPATARVQIYDGNLGRVRHMSREAHASCIACSIDGYIGLGDDEGLPERG